MLRLGIVRVVVVAVMPVVVVMVVIVRILFEQAAGAGAERIAKEAVLDI